MIDTENQKSYCVYKHTSPSDKTYIGITSMEPSDRWQNGKGYKHNKYFWRAIQKYGWDSFKHEILFEDLSKEDACQKEIELIAYYDSTNPQKGYNLSTGGEGSSGAPRSEKTRKKMSNSKMGKNNPNYGKHPSEVTRQKMSNAGKKQYLSKETIKKMSEAKKGKPSCKNGVKLSPESCQRISESKKGNKNPNYGKTISEEQKRKIRESRCKAIIQLDENDNFIAEYSSVVEAERQTGVKSTNICQCCKGKLKTSGGFKWLYKEQYLNTTEKLEYKSWLNNYAKMYILAGLSDEKYEKFIKDKQITNKDELIQVVKKLSILEVLSLGD